jgi:hypothetical protein
MPLGLFKLWFCTSKNKHEVLAEIMGVEKDRLRDLLHVLAAGCMKITQQRFEFVQATGLVIDSNTYDGFNYIRMADATKQGRLHEYELIKL